MIIVAILVASCLLLLSNEVKKAKKTIATCKDCTKISNGIFVYNNHPEALSYAYAKSYCSFRGMQLPSLEDAWQIWISSNNCSDAVNSEIPIIKDKETFLKSCHANMENCLKPAVEVYYSCKSRYHLSINDYKSYRYGNYWLSDQYYENAHYTVSFKTGMTKVSPDSAKLGVRCIKK